MSEITIIGKRKSSSDNIETDSTVADNDSNQPVTKKQKLNVEIIPPTDVILPQLLLPIETGLLTEAGPPTTEPTEPETIQTTEQQYESVPFDLKYMLKRFCCKQHDKIWIPFATSNNAFSMRYVRHLGYGLVEHAQEFFTSQQAPPTATVIVTDAQFSKKRQVLQKLVQLGLPFVVVLPSDTVQRDFFVSILRASIKTHRWLVELPNKTLSFHNNGTILPMPRFKTAFFSCRPIEGEPSSTNGNNEPSSTNSNNEEGKDTNNNNNNNKEETTNKEETICQCIRNKNTTSSSSREDALSLLNVKLVDYAAMRRAAGLLMCNRPFETTSETTLGNTIPQPRKKRQSKRKRLPADNAAEEKVRGQLESGPTETTQETVQSQPAVTTSCQ